MRSKRKTGEPATLIKIWFGGFGSDPDVPVVCNDLFTYPSSFIAVRNQFCHSIVKAGRWSSDYNTQCVLPRSPVHILNRFTTERWCWIVRSLLYQLTWQTEQWSARQSVFSLSCGPDRWRYLNQQPSFLNKWLPATYVSVISATDWS